MSISKTLDERGSRYGRFEEHAIICQRLKDTMQAQKGWTRLKSDQKQALEVIADKIARILNGDPNYIDNWHDIQGYAKLVEDRLQQAEKKQAMSASEGNKLAEQQKIVPLREEILKQQIPDPTHDPVGRPRYVVHSVFALASNTPYFYVRLGDKVVCSVNDEKTAHDITDFLNSLHHIKS